MGQDRTGREEIGTGLDGTSRPVSRFETKGEDETRRDETRRDGTRRDGTDFRRDERVGEFGSFRGGNYELIDPCSAHVDA